MNILRLIYDATWADPQFDEGLGPNERGGEAISFGPVARMDMNKCGKSVDFFFRFFFLEEKKSEPLNGGEKGSTLDFFTRNCF